MNELDILRALSDIKVNDYAFGKRSSDALETCHDDLQMIHRVGLATCRVDYGLTEGARTVERQRKLFKKGRSRVNPDRYTPEVLITKGKHIVNKIEPKSRATDMIAVVPNRDDLIYDETHLAYIAGHLVAVSNFLFAMGLTTHLLRWGGNWDKDGTLIVDQSLKDMPHMELYKP